MEIQYYRLNGRIPEPITFDQWIKLDLIAGQIIAHTTIANFEVKTLFTGKTTDQPVWEAPFSLFETSIYADALTPLSMKPFEKASAYGSALENHAEALRAVTLYLLSE